MKSWKFRAIGATAVAAVLLAGCGSGGKAAETTSSGAAGGTASGATRDLTIEVVVHSNPDGAFWNVVKKAALDAGKQYGITVEVTGDPEGANQAKLIDAAVAKNPDGLVVSMANPDALQSALANAKAKNIPFVTINSGDGKSAEFGAIGHVGQTETAAGEGAGKKLKEAGVTKAICLVSEAGNIGLEQRCQGASDGLAGSMENVQVDITNPQGIQATVKSKLLGDPSINGVLALNSTVAVAALAGMKDAGSTAQIGSFDIDPSILDAIRSGEVLFTIDQQQYLQGYLPIVMLVLYHDNLNTVGGGAPVLTGPSFITKDNVDQVADLVKAGTR